MERKVSSFKRLWELYADAGMRAKPDWRKRHPDQSMPPKEEYRGVFQTIQGRISRKEFILSVVVYYLVIVLISLLLDVLLGDRVVSYLSFFIYWAFAHKFYVWRTHDVGGSAFWVWLGNVILPIILGIGAFVSSVYLWPDLSQEGLEVEDLLGLAILAGLIPTLLLTLVLMCVKGKKGPNKYGEDPLAEIDSTTSPEPSGL